MIANDMCQNTTHLGRNKGSYCSINSPECGWVVVCLLFKAKLRGCIWLCVWYFSFSCVCMYLHLCSKCVRAFVGVCVSVCMCVFACVCVCLCAFVCVCFFIRSNKSEIILKLNKHSCQL